MNKPHKHAEVIKAWADGCKIEVKNNEGKWVPTSPPSFSDNYQYRIHDPLREYKEAYARGENVEVFYQGTWQSVKTIAALGPFSERSDLVFCLEVITKNPLHIVPKPDYTEDGITYTHGLGGWHTAHVSVTIDGVTGKPKYVELVK